MSEDNNFGRSTTRQTIERDPTNPEPHVDSGYEGDGPAENFSIPSVGIEDCDRALFNLFDRDIGFTVKYTEKANKRVQISKPYVIFATGERFAMAKKLRPPRDKNGLLMLPAISIRRTSIEQTNNDITNRGMNQFTGNIVIKRRLDEGDQDYQNLINKFGFQNLKSNVSTERQTGEEKNSLAAQEGAYFDSKLGNNVFEIITAPQPQFFTATYEVIFWTNFTQHMNYMIETYLSSFLPNDRIHKINTTKGYWFLAYTDEQLPSQDNFDELTDDERILRYSFTVRVKGYIFAPQHSTNAVPIRRYVSAPTVSFEMIKYDTQIADKKHMERPPQLSEKSNDDKFILNDISDDPNQRQNSTTQEKFLVRKDVYNPKTKKIERRFVKISERNEAQGETSYRTNSIEALEDFIKNGK
jgi:hypothetical protein